MKSLIKIYIFEISNGFIVREDKTPDLPEDHMYCKGNKELGEHVMKLIEKKRTS